MNKVKLELAACRREVAKEQAEKSTVREVVPPGPVSRQVLPLHDRAPKRYSTVVKQSTEKKAQIITQVEDQPTPRYYRENNKVESEPDRNQSRVQLTYGAQRWKSNYRNKF